MGSVPCWSPCAACLIRSASATSKPSASPSPASISGAIAGSTESSGFSGHLRMVSESYGRSLVSIARANRLRATTSAATPVASIGRAPRANDRAWRSRAREPFSTRPCLAVVAAPWLTNEPRTTTSARPGRVSQDSNMSSPHDVASDAPPTNPTPAIQRLLFVSDAAVAGVDELPPVVRAIIDAATEVNILTPTLPGRLAWLADDVDRFRHYADERLDTVLSQMHAIGVDAGGAARRGSVLTVIADAVTAFAPDHILIALHVSERANWQERGLTEHVEDRFRLPVSTFAVDPAGH